MDSIKKVDVPQSIHKMVKVYAVEKDMNLPDAYATIVTRFLQVDAPHIKRVLS